MIDLEEQNYFLRLREKGAWYYTKEDILKSYREFIISIETDGYDGIKDELDWDFGEIWKMVNGLKDILEKKEEKTTEDIVFLSEFKQLDQQFLDLTVPLELTVTVDWWISRVLKRASKTYAEDIKDSSGIEVEIIE